MHSTRNFMRNVSDSWESSDEVVEASEEEPDILQPPVVEHDDRRRGNVWERDSEEEQDYPSQAEYRTPPSQEDEDLRSQQYKVACQSFAQLFPDALPAEELGLDLEAIEEAIEAERVSRAQALADLKRQESEKKPEKAQPKKVRSASKRPPVEKVDLDMGDQEDPPVNDQPVMPEKEVREFFNDFEARYVAAVASLNDLYSTIRAMNGYSDFAGTFAERLRDISNLAKVFIPAAQSRFASHPDYLAVMTRMAGEVLSNVQSILPNVEKVAADHARISNRAKETPAERAHTTLQSIEAVIKDQMSELAKQKPEEIVDKIFDILIQIVDKRMILSVTVFEDPQGSQKLQTELLILKTSLQHLPCPPRETKDRPLARRLEDLYQLIGKGLYLEQSLAAVSTDQKTAADEETLKGIQTELEEMQTELVQLYQPLSAEEIEEKEVESIRALVAQCQEDLRKALVIVETSNRKGQYREATLARNIAIQLQKRIQDGQRFLDTVAQNRRPARISKTRN